MAMDDIFGDDQPTAFGAVTEEPEQHEESREGLQEGQDGAEPTSAEGEEAPQEAAADDFDELDFGSAPAVEVELRMCRFDPERNAFVPVEDAEVKEEPPRDPQYDRAARIRALEHEYADAGLRVLELEERLKQLKEDLAAARNEQKEIAEELQSLTDGGDLQGSLFDGDGNPTPAATGGVVGAEPATPAEPPNEDWRKVPITDLPLGEIKGLGRKKLEVLAEHCPTIGELVDLDGAGGIDCLPGWGEAMADKVKDALVEWLAVHRDAAALREAKGIGEARKAAETRLADLAENMRKGGNFRRYRTDREWWEEGVRAFSTGNEIDDCPYDERVSRCEWVRGFLHAESKAAVDDAAQGEGETTGEVEEGGEGDE